MSGSPGAADLRLRIEQGLEGALDLRSLAREAGLSPFHFHRRFVDAIGETPRRHIERLRLERAAYLVAVTEARLVDVGLSVGFRTHETFSRAFRRRFGRSPRDYRKSAQTNQNARAEANRGFRGDGCSLSEVRFTTLRPTWLLTVRRTGAYGAGLAPPFSAGDAHWRRLADWGERRGLPVQRTGWGFFGDDPNVTPPDQQRADLCLPVARPAEGDDQVRCMAFEGGPYAVIEHLGPYPTIDQAYRGCADGIRRSSQYVFAEGPPLQIFRASAIGGDPDLNHSEVCFPVRRRR